MAPAPDLALFISGFQDVNQKKFFVYRNAGSTVFELPIVTDDTTMRTICTSHYPETVYLKSVTVPRDLRLQVFFINQYVHHYSRFEFFEIR